MALKDAIQITCTKILDGPKQAYTYNGSGKDIILITKNILRALPTGASDEDTIFVMTDGTLIWGVESFDDTSNEISASDQTGS